MEGLYILHFDSPVEYDNVNRYGDNQHYVGISRSLEHRLSKHLSGQGSYMSKAAKKQLISIQIGLKYPCEFNSKFEFLVTKRAKYFCIICSKEREGSAIQLISTEESLRRMMIRAQRSPHK